ncbi:class I tRNA ligase family protein, partial [Sphingorhabdus sp.]|uniref:class I tRNA ligase family protein n=1 Tax=Sphingorhabdus sp. TaxID=1902408 RepID=UPI0032B7C792
YKHSYPHSWRSKAKIIYRCTPQWFAAMDRPIEPLPFRGGVGEGLKTLRQAAVQAIAETRFVPEKGRNRIGSMVEGRPDWVLSRQRAWGVPITLFVNRNSGAYLTDAAVNARIVAAFRAEGVDAWEAARAQEYLGDAYRADDYEQVFDILDVWFDSGCTHVFTLESGKWPELSWPADLYLEGSDQHRGWFQSSLLESCGTRGRAPYDAVLTHGFTMDAKGRKMSKSEGNTIDPLKIMETSGADIIRLWALSVDYTEDHRIGDEILKGVSDQYRKLRNTFRYMLGALDGFDEEQKKIGTVPIYEELPELERYVLHLLSDMDAKLRAATDSFDFNTYVRLLSDFANEDLSAFFFDIRKDCLYCDAPSSPKRRAYRTVLDTLFHALVRYAAPVLVFTAEEVWATRFPDAGSVHLLEWPELPNLGPSHAGRDPDAPQGLDPGLRRDDELVEKWTRLREFRASVTEAIEPLRREKAIGSSLEAEGQCLVSDPRLLVDASEVDFAELCIVQSISVAEHEMKRAAAIDTILPPLFRFTRTTHHKCGRCWRHLPEVAEDGALCTRCADVVGG